MYEVTLLPVFGASIVSMVLGFVWYHPKVFGTAWMRMTGFTPSAIEKGKRWMPLIALGGILASMFAAYIMNRFGTALGVYDVKGAIELGFMCWAGFVAPVLFWNVLWDQKPLTLYLINASYWLIAFVAMALVLVL